MASLRTAVTSARAFLRRQIAPLPPPANPPAATSSNSGCAPRCPRLPHASLRGVSSLAVEDAPGLDPAVAAPEAAGEGSGSERRSGFSTLRSLFAQPSTSSIPKSAGKDGRVKSDGLPSRFAGPRSRMRPAKSADSGSSVGSGRAGEVSPEMALFIRRLHDEGYLKNASFSQEVDSCRVVANSCARGLLMTAAQRFGEDHQEIAKWLSGSSLKRVAVSGCPCTERKTVFAAKRLRSFFCIQEDIICRGCKMKTSCKFVNQNVNREGKLILADVMRVLTAYALDSVPNNLKLEKELTHSVGKSLKEVISLSA